MAADAAQRIAPSRQPNTKSGLRVVKGAGRKIAESVGISPSLYFAVRVAFVALAILAVVAVIRVGMTTATVSTLMANNSIQTEINQAVSYSNDLKVQEAVFGNPSRIKSIAVDSLGMKAPDVVAYMDISGRPVGSQANNTDKVAAADVALSE